MREGEKGIPLEPLRVPAVPPARTTKEPYLPPKTAAGLEGGRTGDWLRGPKTLPKERAVQLKARLPLRRAPAWPCWGQPRVGTRTGTSGRGATCLAPLPCGRLRPGSGCPPRAGWQGRRGRLPRGHHLQGKEGRKKGSGQGDPRWQDSPKDPRSSLDVTPTPWFSLSV